jgi:hypothetical protein
VSLDIDRAHDGLTLLGSGILRSGFSYLELVTVVSYADAYLLGVRTVKLVNWTTSYNCVCLVFSCRVIDSILILSHPSDVFKEISNSRN